MANTELYRVTSAAMKSDQEKEVFANPDGEAARSHYQMLRKLKSKNHVTLRLYRGQTLLSTSSVAANRAARLRANSPM